MHLVVELTDDGDIFIRYLTISNLQCADAKQIRGVSSINVFGELRAGTTDLRLLMSSVVTKRAKTPGET